MEETNVEYVAVQWSVRWYRGSGPAVPQQTGFGLTPMPSSVSA